MAYLEDVEKRLLLAALAREKEVCQRLDDRKVEDASAKMLVPIVESIENKFCYDKYEKDIRNKAIDELLQKQLEVLEDFKDWEDSNNYPIHSVSETQRISKCKELIKQVAKELKGGSDKPQ